MADFSQRLRELRTGRGWSQEALAHQLSVSRQAVQKWEAGTARPDLDNLTALSKLFHVSLDWLVLGREADDTPQREPAAQTLSFPCYEYRSRIELFGLPLVHISFGLWRPRPARGIFAVGNIAAGVVAVGGLAAGGLAFGGVSLGLLALGGLALGGISIGGLALGLFALGGGAIGVWAVGGLAVGQTAALGGAAFAPYALGESASGAFAVSTGDPSLTEAELQEQLRQFWQALSQVAPWFARLFRGLFGG